MRTHRFRSLASALTLAAVAFVLPACSDDGTGPENDEDAYVGTWNATSFAALGQDFIAQGMTLTGTFTTSTYTFTATADAVGVCGDEGTDDCTTTGPLVADGNQITIDVGTEDAVTFDYAISGNTMTFTGSIDGISAVVVWARAN